MKKIGLIGGIGPESTVLYYKKLIHGLRKDLGNHFLPEIVIDSLNVFKVLEYCQQKNYKGLVDYLMIGIQNLISSGAEVIALTGNTPHIVFDELQLKSAIPLVSIVESTYYETKKKRLSKLGLIGTSFTMKEDFFKNTFLLNGVEIITPTLKDQDYIANKIVSELEIGIIREETREDFIKTIKKMKNNYQIEGVILGCTELPLLFESYELPVITLDTVDIHIKHIIHQAKGASDE